MTFGIVDITTYLPIRSVVAEVEPFSLSEFPDKGDIITVLKSGQSLEFEVRWIACPRVALFPEGYPKVDRLIIGVFK